MAAVQRGGIGEVRHPVHPLTSTAPDKSRALLESYVAGAAPEKYAYRPLGIEHVFED